MVIYGPTPVLSSYIKQLGLVELEDYSIKVNQDKSDGDKQKLYVWEMIPKKSGDLSFKILNPDVSDLSENEQVWWQILLQPLQYSFLDKAKLFLTNLFKFSALPSNPMFLTAIRVVIVSNDIEKAKTLRQAINKSSDEVGLTSLPSILETEDLYKSYVGRSLPLGVHTYLKLTTPQKIVNDRAFLTDLSEVRLLLGL